MGLALQCHGELKLTNGRKGRERRYKEKEGVVPTSPNTPSSSPKCVLCASTLQKMHSPRESRRNRFNFFTSTQVSLSAVPALLSVKKCELISAQHPKVRTKWC